MSLVLAVAVAATLALGAQEGAVNPQPTALPRVLLLPLDPCRATPDLCTGVVSALAADPLLKKHYRVVTMKEIEGALSQQQVREISGCDSDTCAAEIAGALNAEEIVFGNMGVVGNSYVLTLARVKARNAQSEGRILRKFSKGEEERFIDEIGLISQELFGLDPATSSKPRDASSTTAVLAQDAPRRISPMVVAGVAGLGVAGLLALAGAGFLAANVLVVAVDVSQTGQPPWGAQHAVGANVAAAASLSLLMGVAAGVLTGVLGVPSAVALVWGWVAP